MGRPRHLARHDALHLAHLFHQVRACVEATRRVDDHHVRPARDARLDPVEDHRGGIRARTLTDELRPGSLRPDAQLLDRGGTERVAGDEKHPSPRRRMQRRELADGGRLPDSVDPEHQDDPRAGGGLRRLVAREHRLDLVPERRS